MTTSKPSSVIILMADDDDDDFLLTQKALQKNSISTTITQVQDGEKLLDYLRNSGKYEGEATRMWPTIILLDLNMPKMDGWEALRAIKADPKIADIPVIVFTTSGTETDIKRAYQLGANSFITKPTTFKGLVEVMHILSSYWFDVVTLPNRNGNR